MIDDRIPNKIKQHQDKTVRKHSGIETYEKTWILVPVSKKIIKQIIEPQIRNRPHKMTQRSKR